MLVLTDSASQGRAVKIEFICFDHFDLRKLLLQCRQKLSGVAHNDDAGAVDVEVRRGKALNVLGFDSLHATDELIDLIEVHAINCQ